MKINMRVAALSCCTAVLLVSSVVAYLALQPRHKQVPPAASAKRGAVRFASLDGDLGTIPYRGQKASFTYRFTNDGPEPVRITRVSTSCGCTASDYVKDSIAPGAEGMVTLLYDPTYYNRIGAVTQGAVVSFAGNGNPQVRINLRAQVVELLPVTPSVVAFGEFDQRQPQTRTISILNSLPQPIRIKQASAEKKTVNVEIAAATAQPGDSLKVVVKTPPSLAVTEFTDTIIVETDCKELPVIRVPVAGLARNGPVSVEPKVIVYGMVNRERDLRKMLRLRSDDGSDFQIQAIQAEGIPANSQFDRGSKPSQELWLTPQLKDLNAGAVNGQVRIDIAHRDGKQSVVVPVSVYVLSR